MGEDLSGISGTSASTPVFAAFVTQWNDLRLRMGKKPLGFINPFLYQLYADHPEAFNDVVVGDTKCLVHGYDCCSEGFSAMAGYDPVTGLGTPKWKVIANAVMNPKARFPSLQVDDERKSDTEESRLGSGSFVFVILFAIFLIIGCAYALRTTIKQRQQAGLEDSSGRNLLSNQIDDGGL